MKCKKHIHVVALVLVLLMSLSCVACHVQKQDDKEVPSESTADTSYRVRVMDQDGAPMEGVTVQICSHVCQMGKTDADGVALFAVAPGDYKASVTVMPAGYTYASEQTEFPLGEASREATITLKRIPPEVS